MKMLGIIAGMSWESSIEYYRMLNELVRARLGGAHSCKMLMHSVDFDEIQRRQHAGEWGILGQQLAAIARQLEAGGAEALVLATNTMHLVAPEIEAATTIPFLHIADGTGAKIRAAGRKKIGLLGTKFTMEEAFYKGRLVEKFGLKVQIPDENDRAEVHRIIYEELILGEIRDSSRQFYQKVVQKLAEAGCEGVILGCTEIGLLIGPADCEIEVFDTAKIHVEAAVDFALGTA